MGTDYTKLRQDSSRTVLFSDYNTSKGVGTRIQFKDGDLVVHTEFMGDADYNGSICDWILFGNYTPTWERAENL